MKISNTFQLASCLLLIFLFSACGDKTQKSTEDAAVSETTDTLRTITINPVTTPCPNMDADSGCSCDFQVGDEYVFRSDYQNGCINIDGKVISVKEVIFEDERTRLVIQSQNEYWIILNEKGDDTIFGKKLAMGDQYEEHRAALVQTLLVMDELPSEIPYQSNGTVGMGYRAEVRDMCDEALQMAKAAKERGETGPPTELRFQNENYQVHFIVKSTGTDDGGGNNYKGEMKVLSSDGTVLGSKQVKGYCGC